MRSSHDPAPVAQLHQKRQAALELEYALDALEKQLKVLADELVNTETAKIPGFLANLTGTKQKQIDRIHSLQEELNNRHGQMTQMMDALNQEISVLNDEAKQAAEKKSKQESLRDQRRKEIEAMGGEVAEKLNKCRREIELSDVMLTKLQTAMDACEEARRDLLSEIETVSTFGRAHLLKANRAFKMLANHVRKGASEDCAQRVRQSLTRLKRKLDEMLKSNVKDRELDTLSNELALHIQTFSGTELTRNTAVEHSASVLHDQLQTTAMVLERRISTTQGQLTDARNRHDKLLDSAPKADDSLGGDAIQMTSSTKV